MAAPLSFASGTVSEQVDRLVEGALTAGASDVHIEPVSDGASGIPTGVRVRYRVDGVLREAGRLPASSAAGVVARIKVLASLDIAEKRRPQDGRIAFRSRAGGSASGPPVDLRVSTVPSTAGEKVVLRVLDRSALRLDFDALGLQADGLQTDGLHADGPTARARAAVDRALARPHGLVLVTGPTGSGKTTTLYAALASLDRDRLNVLSVEDPVEYDVAGVTQVAARPELGVGFAEALRAFLRQDPDVIMVGEIRDAETARIAVRSALTGHLVLSTLHTNDAPSAAARLVDMGVEPYLLASSLRLIVAQRLVRLLCAACAAPVEAGSVEDAQARSLAGEPLAGEEGASGFQRPVGCDACGGTGFRGRTAVFEVVEADEAFQALVARGASAAELRAQARASGARSLREAAAELVRAGRTTATEVLRATDQ